MKYFYYVAFSLLIYSCSSIEVVEESSAELNQINENTKFENFLDNEWDKSLSENPLFASYVGDKRNNNKINSNSIEQFNNEKQSNIESLSNLKKIDISKLSDENILNYKLYEFGVRRNIDLANFPTYFLRINQRGGIQSFYETGNRLVYTNSQDYYD